MTLIRLVVSDFIGNTLNFFKESFWCVWESTCCVYGIITENWCTLIYFYRQHFAYVPVFGISESSDEEMPEVYGASESEVSY